MLLSDSDYGLGLSGTPGPLVSRLFGITGADKTGQDYSELGLHGRPDNPRSFAGRVASSTQSFVVSDTASISVTEDPVDRNEITTTDTARIAVSDTSQMFNRIDVADTARLSVGETISLLITGVTLKTASDTASLSVSEAVTVNVSLDVTDTASISVSDTSSVEVSVEQITVSDTASLSVDDQQQLEIFAGFVDKTVHDDALLTLTETAVKVEVNRIRRITFTAMRPKITFEVI